MFTVTATHQGDYRGVPATGEPITFKGITVAQMENGKIVDEFFVATKMGAVMFGQTLDQD
jgi:predicted ester cyclase